MSLSDEETHISDNESDIDEISEIDYADDNETLDDDSNAVPQNDSIYPPFLLNTTLINPLTGRRYTRKEINLLYKGSIEERWDDEPPEIATEPFHFIGAHPGPTGLELDAISVLERFISNDVVIRAVECSNAYLQSERYQEKNSKSYQGYNSPISIKDFWMWTAVQILSSIHNKANIDDNWATDPLLFTPSFSAVMPKNRFKFINSILHLAKDEEFDSTDKLWKVRKFLDTLNYNFQSSYNLGAEISIDESLMMYRVHHSYIRYIPNKAARFGFKVYYLAEADTGYAWRFVFDEGSNTRLTSNCPESLNKPGQVVWTLMNGFPNQPSILNEGRLLAVDNFYTDIHLFFHLRRNRTDAIGTVRANKADLPKSVMGKKFKKHEKGSRVIKWCDDFFLLNWMDKKEVRILSSVSSGISDDDVVTRESLGGRPEIRKPKCIQVYNSYAGS
jgi:hypothetical protein